MANNDYTDFRWDDRVLESLRSLGRRLILLDTDLVTALAQGSGAMPSVTTPRWPEW